MIADKENNTIENKEMTGLGRPVISTARVPIFLIHQNQRFACGRPKTFPFHNPILS
jgi:hypothetical protein